MGDGEDPRRDVLNPPSPQALESLEEDLARDVLSQIRVPQPAPAVPVDAGHVAAIELCHRGRIRRSARCERLIGFR